MEGKKEIGLEQVLNLIGRAVTAVESITELRKQKLTAEKGKEKEKEERLVAESEQKLYRISYLVTWTKTGVADKVHTGFFCGKDLLNALETAKAFLTGHYARGEEAYFSLIGATELCGDGDYDKFAKLSSFWALKDESKADI